MDDAHISGDASLFSSKISCCALPPWDRSSRHAVQAGIPPVEPHPEIAGSWQQTEPDRVGLAAYFLDHDARSYALISRVFAGETEGLTRDDVLDNITITWLTNSALSGARLYWEYRGKGGYFHAKGVSIPVAVSVFPDELYPAPRSWTEQAYPKLIHFNKLPKGGHFAAWEQPKLFSEEVRAGFRSLR
jgi:pimeloyl-ACP methyl ester carboxylesterase